MNRALEALGVRIAEAVASGDFDLARALTEEAIRLRAGTGGRTTAGASS